MTSAPELIRRGSSKPRPKARRGKGRRLTKAELVRLTSLRARTQDVVDDARNAAEQLMGTAGASLAARLECLVADCLDPALKDLAAIEEACAFRLGEVE